MTTDEILDAVEEDFKMAMKMSNARMEEIKEGTLSGKELRKRRNEEKVYDERIKEAVKELKRRAKGGEL